MNTTDPLEEHFRLQENQKKALKRLGILSVHDLLYHFPTRYTDLADVKLVRNLVGDEKATLYGKIRNIKTKKSFRTKVPMAEGTFYDDTGTVKVLWFHQPYIAKMVHEERFVKLEGKVSEKNGSFSIMNPEYEHIDYVPINISDSLFENEGDTPLSYPVYPESRGITSKWMYHALQRVFSSGVLDTMIDPIPESILKTYNLPPIKTALIWIHTPRKQSDSLAARKRFAFEEIFYIQLQKQRQRVAYEAEPSYIIDETDESVHEFIERFPFTPTDAQITAIHDIRQDIGSEHSMSRLLEGDVGSGKTFVAATTAYAAVMTRPPKEDAPNERQDFGNLQVAYMAPTEILAKQHFESFTEMFSHLPVNIGLITGSGCKKFPSKVDPTGATKISRAQLLKWVKNGEIAILIGTHSLIQKSVAFKDLAYVIIDEQHRFGINQRKNLTRKGGPLPHLLSMTATPIPRTLALTIYGDLDLTLLDQMPSGRKPIITDIIPPNKREKTYDAIRKELEAGRQLYVICPRIDEPDPEKQQAVLTKSVKEEAKRLKKDIFKDYSIDILHGKMKPAEKETVMERFLNHDIDILVATSVVEVGVNVPNATVIIIEGAERFGLAQLHQLRGRVIRGTHQAYCYVFTDSNSKKTKERLTALKESKNGFELSEYDLKLRGAGELTGKKQWGISDLGMEAIRNIKMVEAARKEAARLVSGDPTLKDYPYLKEQLKGRVKEIHFE